MTCMMKKKLRLAGRVVLAMVLLQAGLAVSVRAEFHLPWQRPDNPPLCRVSQNRSYFRPEYGELAQRLAPDKLNWIVRNFPALGWQGMDPRLYRPKEVPGTTERDGFRYDPLRRHLQLEALFHFGPVGGNGTLIEDAIWLDSNRILTVNRGSDNISLVDVVKPDILGTLEAPQGIAAFEINRKANELYLLEHGATGMLIFSLNGDYSPVDTMLLDFTPAAVLLPPGGSSLFLTDEETGTLVRFDLTGRSETSYLPVDLKPPFMVAAHTQSETLVLVSRNDGQVRLVDMRNFSLRPDRLSAGKPVTRLVASDDKKALYLISAVDSDRSQIHGLSVDSRSFSLHHLASLEGVVRGLSAPEGGGELFAVAGEFLYRIGAQGARGAQKVRIGESTRAVAVSKDRVFVSAGIDHIYALDRKFKERPERIPVEMGPGPLLVRDSRLYVVNCLSNSITVLKGKNLEEEVSVLLGVLLGRMYYRDRKIVVNNLFRGNVMVLDPESYRIEEILPAGGSIHYDSISNAYTVFDDSLVTRLPAPPSSAGMNPFLVLPDGVRLFAYTGNPGLYLLADQNRYVGRLHLESNMRRGQIPLPSPALAMLEPEGGPAYVLTEREVCSIRAGNNVGLDNTWSARPARFNPPWLASDGFSPGRGSLLMHTTGSGIRDVFTAHGSIEAIRNDPDTTFSWVAAGGDIYVFDSQRTNLLSSYSLRWNIVDIVLPHWGRNVYAVTTDQVVAFDRKTLMRYDDISVGGQVVYAHGDDLFLMHPDYPRRMVVADGYRGGVFQELELPVVPTDAAANNERLFLLGATQGALAIYVNRIDSARMPRSNDRSARDTQADRRAGFHR